MYGNILMVSWNHITSSLDITTSDMCCDFLLHPCGSVQRTKDSHFEESSGDVCNALILLGSEKALSNCTLQHKFFIVCYDKVVTIHILLLRDRAIYEQRSVLQT